jgi:hypothetical protein
MLAAAALCLGLSAVFVACGSNKDTTALSGANLAKTPENRLTTPTATPLPLSSTNEPAPVLGGNITAISPQHGAKVKQAATTSPDPNKPRGVCAAVNFKDLPENFQWFRMVFDGQEVTQQLSLVATTDVDPQNGEICYAPAKGFSIGHHIAGVAVQSPRDPNAETRQIVQWSFDVVP